MIHFGRSRRRMSPEARRRALEEWEAWPLEGRVALVAVPLACLAAVHLVHLVPGVHDVISMEELGAAGLIMAIISVVFVQFTFGRVARLNLERKRALTTSRPDLDTGLATGIPLVSPRAHDTALVRLDRLQQHDPAFSERLLGVFSRALLLRATEARDPAAQAALVPYISPAAMRDLRVRIGEADRVLTGPTRVVEVSETEVWTTLTLSQPFLAAEGGQIRRVPLTWVLRRTSAARSPSPVDLTAFTCPACGAPVEFTHPDGQCTTCTTAITHGQLSWQVVEVTGAPTGPAWPEGIPRGGAHPSVRPPTLEDPALPASLRALAARHPELPTQRIELRAAAATAAWFDGLAAGDLDRARPHLTDELTDALRHEIARLKVGRLAATGGPAAVQQVEWVRCGRDGWHEVADLRVFLTLPWHVVDAEGRTVDGHPEEPRELSVIARLVHPQDSTHTEAGWRLWQVVDPRDYAR